MPPKSINLALGLDAPKEPVCAVTEAAYLPYSPEEWRQKQSDQTLAHIIKTLKQDHHSKGPFRHPRDHIDKHDNPHI